MVYKSKYLKYKNKCIILKDKLNNIIKKIKLISMGTNKILENDYTNNILADPADLSVSNTDIIYEILDEIIDRIDLK
jgi:hypothetical protein